LLPATEAFSQDYGTEWEAAAPCKSGTSKNREAMLKFADFQTTELATDATKVWLQFAATF